MTTAKYSALAAPKLTRSESVAVLEAKLAPATDWQIEKALAYLTANLSVGDDDDAQLIAKREGLISACRGYPATAIEETTQAFVTGRVAGASKRFCPTSAELGAELARRVSHDRDELTRAKRIKADAEERAREERAPISAATRELARKRIAELQEISRQEREALTSRAPLHPELDRHRGELSTDGRRMPIRRDWRVPSLPLTPEDVAHLPDASKKGALGTMRQAFEGFFPRRKPLA
jgi:hypothetical protein